MVCPHHNANPDWQCRHTFGDSISIQILQIERSRDGIARGRSGFNLLEGNSDTQEGQLITMHLMRMALLIPWDVNCSNLLMTMVLHLKDNFDITVIVVPLMMEMVGQVFAENCF